MADIAGHKSATSILLVEDDKQTLEFLGNILAKKYPGITIHAADDGRKGLEHFQAYLPDIVITDFNMPEMHGMQMANEIRALKPETKFIILTGNNGIPSNQISDERGVMFDHLIVKPVIFQDLFMAIEQCIGNTSQH